MQVADNVQALLRDLERRLMRAHARDADALAHHLAPDFVEFGCSGRRYDKLQVVALWRSCAEARPIEASEFACTGLTPECVLLTYQAFRPGPPAQRSLRSSLWRLQGGQWQMVFHQGTLTA